MKDKVNSGEVDVRYCPKDKMWADVLTKPLQGTEYKVFRARLMNIPEEYDDSKPFQTNTEALGRKVSFAARTKPGATTSGSRPIYAKGRLQGCVGGGRTTRQQETERRNIREPMRTSKQYIEQERENRTGTHGSKCVVYVDNGKT